MHDELLSRFPGAIGDWARFDGPAGTQMVDCAIDAVREWSASGNGANGGGHFAAADATDDLVRRARLGVQRLFGAPTDTIVFGPNMTTLTFSFTRAIARDLDAGDRIVGTMLDHDANVTPWSMAAADTGADHVLAPFDPQTGRFDLTAFESLLDDRTRWVAVTGASNLIGTAPDLAAITALAHDAGARVFVDAVALAPHQPIDITALGCDVLVTSAYKWYGPHAAAMWVEPELLESLRPYKVRPAADHGPKRFETGTPNFEGLAGVLATADFLSDIGIEAIAAHESAVFAPLLEGLQSMPNVTVYGPQGLEHRIPTVSFTVAGQHPDETARSLAHHRIATWSGHSYAVEVARRLGVDATGGVVRAGVSRYVTTEDVQRLLGVVAELAGA